MSGLPRSGAGDLSALSGRAHNGRQSISQVNLSPLNSADVTTHSSKICLKSPDPLNSSCTVEPTIGPSQDVSQKAAKVAVPRVNKQLDLKGGKVSRKGGRTRVTQACEPCRYRRTKCSGGRPECGRCQDLKIACYYAEGKRGRMKKQFGSLTKKVVNYEKLLRDLALRVSEADSKLIQNILEKGFSLDTCGLSFNNPTAPSVRPIAAEENLGVESNTAVTTTPLGDLGRIEEDFTRDEARETGFIGIMSEITWLQRLRQESKDGARSPREARQTRQRAPSSSDSHEPKGEAAITLAEATGNSIHEISYHLDDSAIATFEDVDPYEIPAHETAQTLFNAYITRIHPTFPIVGKLNFTAQFHKVLSGQAQRPPEKWLAILNLIFAIAAKYSHLIHADSMGGECDHIIYFTRARLLSLKSDTVFEHPDLQIIQITALLSFYFLCTSQINRAWNVAGIALRWAMALGLNLRNESTILDDCLKEIRYRVWWALYVLEHRLCGMTGRNNCILDDHCTTPLPLPVEEEQFDSEEASRLLSIEQQRHSRAPYYNSQNPNLVSSSSGFWSQSATNAKGSRSPSTTGAPTWLELAMDVPANPSLYFLYLVQLTRLTQVTFHRLYSTSATEKSWSNVQDTIRQLDEQMETWYRSLPLMFDFRRRQSDRSFYEFRLSLGFFYYGTKVMVHRPSLCRSDPKVPYQTSKSLNFNRQAAATCVKSARDLLELIPDEPNAVGLIQVGPWWCVLHCLVQACTVLMLEISFRAQHLHNDVDTILDASKKGVRWLYALGEDNLSARRAWHLCSAALRDTATRIGRNVTDLPQRPPGCRPGVELAGFGQSSSGTPNHSAFGTQWANAPSTIPPVYPELSKLENLLQCFPVEWPMIDATYLKCQPTGKGNLGNMEPVKRI